MSLSTTSQIELAFLFCSQELFSPKKSPAPIWNNISMCKAQKYGFTPEEKILQNNFCF